MTQLHGTLLPLVMMWILLLPTEASGAQTMDFGALDGYIEDEMAHARIPGLALTIYTLALLASGHVADRDTPLKPALKKPLYLSFV